MGWGGQNRRFFSEVRLGVLDARSVCEVCNTNPMRFLVQLASQKSAFCKVWCKFKAGKDQPYKECKPSGVSQS